MAGAEQNEPWWPEFVKEIKEANCTPFIGAGASYPSLPLGPGLAEILSKSYGGYPLPIEYPNDLMHVAQYIAIDSEDRSTPKAMVRKYIQSCPSPDFKQPNDPHGLLADLKLPLYITTNYDNFIWEALNKRERVVKRLLCPWNGANTKKSPDREFVDPTADNPAVFHLHGYYEDLDSMVLTEDDHIDMLVGVSTDFAALFPTYVQEAIRRTPLMFIGYGLRDLDFQLIHALLGKEDLREKNKKPGITIQLPREKKDANKTPEEQLKEKERAQKMQAYLVKYFNTKNLRVFWGTANEFVDALRGHL